jgi:hypothetical protein
MSTAPNTFSVRGHMVGIERLEKQRWRVRIDGQSFAIFHSEARARAAGRTEARRLDLVAREPRPRAWDGEGR